MLAVDSANSALLSEYRELPAQSVEGVEEAKQVVQGHAHASHAFHAQHVHHVARRVLHDRHDARREQVQQRAHHDHSHADSEKEFIPNGEHHGGSRQQQVRDVPMDDSGPSVRREIPVLLALAASTTVLLQWPNLFSKTGQSPVEGYPNSITAAPTRKAGEHAKTQAKVKVPTPEKYDLSREAGPDPLRRKSSRVYPWESLGPQRSRNVEGMRGLLPLDSIHAGVRCMGPIVKRAPYLKIPRLGGERQRGGRVMKRKLRQLPP